MKTKFKLPSLDLIIDNFKSNFRRFPFVMVDAILGTIIGIILIDLEFPDYEQYTYLYRLLMTLVLGFPLLLAIQLYAERQSGKNTIAWIAQGGGILFLIGYYWLLPENFQYAREIHFFRFLLFGIGFTLAVTFAPFLYSPEIKKWWQFFSRTRDELNGFWHYNRVIFLRFFFAYIFFGVLFIGICIALGSIDFLFDVDIPDELYGQLWVFISGILATNYFLAGVPTDFLALEKSKEYAKGIKYFSQYILLPLVMLNFVILYLYAGKVLISGEWPEGMLTWMITLFSLVGIIASVLLYPLRQDPEHVWIRRCNQLFYFSVIPLTFMMFWAIWLRISEYGITENRYFVVLIGLWLLGVSIYFLFSKRNNIKVLPISAFFLVLLSSFGPWGAFSVSEQNQVARLHHYFTESGILIDGKVSPLEKEHDVTRAEMQQMSAILDYLDDRHGFLSIQPWFDEDVEQLPDTDEETTALKSFERDMYYHYDHPRRIMNYLGLEYVTWWEIREPDSKYFYLHSMDNLNLEIDKYGFITEFMVHTPDDKNVFEWNGKKYSVYLNQAQKQIVLRQADRDLMKVPIQSMLDELVDRYFLGEIGMRENIAQKDLTIDASNERYLLRIVINNVNGKRENEDMEITSLTGYLLLGEVNPAP